MVNHKLYLSRTGALIALHFMIEKGMIVSQNLSKSKNPQHLVFQVGHLTTEKNT